jgi:cyclopropane fatty-acyl-phospholipid synthase-like methyltransferase
MAGSGKTLFERLFGRRAAGKRVEALYDEKEYLDAYAEHTDQRVEVDPHSAVGGSWEEIGRLQYDFLVARGLQPHHRMLDIGCGTLRGGRHFIGYLDAGNYTGVDISSKAIEYAKQLVTAEGLAPKMPQLIVNEKKTLTFDEFPGQTFDYLLAQSVFTHLKAEHIEECFANIRRIMHPKSSFYFTYFGGRKYQSKGLKTFRFPYSFFQQLSQQYGFTLRDCAAQYQHPVGQLMVEMTRK